MGIRIKIRRDTSTNFSTVNPVLALGELAYETDTKRFKIGNGTTSWNSLPYLTIAESQDILDRIKNVDGSGSGLDADLLDGQHASSFSLTTHNHDSTYVKLTDYEDADVLAKIKNVDGSGSGLDADLLDGQHASSFSLTTHNHDSTYVKLTDYEDLDVLNKIKNVDGSGSGLDADLLDGLHSSSFARVDAIPVFSGGASGSEGGEVRLLKCSTPISGELSLTSDMCIDTYSDYFRVFASFSGDSSSRVFNFDFFRNMIRYGNPNISEKVLCPYSIHTTNSSITAQYNSVVYVDCRSSAITITLPNSNPKYNGYFVTVVDEYGASSTNNITVARNGNTIRGLSEDFIIDVNYGRVTFVWSVNSNTWLLDP